MNTLRGFFLATFIIGFFVSRAAGFAQIRANAEQDQIRVTGTIRDINTHKEIGSVNIIVDSTNYGAVSDFTGKYTLVVPNRLAHNTVLFRHISYNVVKIPLDSLREDAFEDGNGILFAETELPDHSNLDLHISKSLRLVSLSRFLISLAGIYSMGAMLC